MYVHNDNYLSEIGNVTKQSDHVFRIEVVKKIPQI